jgi:hypothetical protein
MYSKKQMLIKIMKEKKEEKAEIKKYWVDSGLHDETMAKINEKIENSKIDEGELPF